MSALTQACWDPALAEERNAGLMGEDEAGGAAEGAEEQRRLFGARVKERRKSLNMTQTELAERTGLEQMHISQIERGKVSSRHDTMYRLAKALGQELHEMLKPE